MKKILVATIIAVCSLALMLYLFQNLSPWDMEKINDYIKTFGISDGTEFDAFVEDSIKAGIIFDYLNTKNILILNVVFIISATSVLSVIHMIIDKLFFKKFYQEPNHLSAIRRTIWIPIVFIIINFTRLVGGFNILNTSILFLLILLFGLVEYNIIVKRRLRASHDLSSENDIILSESQNKENKLEVNIDYND